mgnify:CR=1 FL=1
MAKEQYYGTGRRKSSVARVRLVPGNGKITINGRTIDEYFGLDTLKLIVRQPLELTKTTDKFDVIAKVEGGGFTGQEHFLKLIQKLTEQTLSQQASLQETQE